jgi:hypothetical protein
VCIRVEFRASRKGSGVHGYFDVRRWFDDKSQGGRIVEGAKGPENEWKGDAYLRLERQDGNLGFAISSDGENWKRSGAIGGVREKLKVGLAAYSTSTDSSKVVFDQLTIRHGEQRRRPWEFVSGWGNPIDPDKDCKIKRDKDSLTVEMPGSEHDYDPGCKCFNAPRLISNLEGEFDVQIRVRIDSHPSAPSTAKGQPSIVSAGFLLTYPEPEYSICDRMEYAVSQLRRRLDGSAIQGKRIKINHHEGSKPGYFSGSLFSGFSDMRIMPLPSAKQPQGVIPESSVPSRIRDCFEQASEKPEKLELSSPLFPRSVR